MNVFKIIWLKTGFGQLTVALFIICVGSEVFLAIPFDIANPYESISLLMIANPAASLFRNLHYCSAQLFLVFSLLHIWDHLKKIQKIKLNPLCI
jgi:quinol-cytochrome oxidoreductase complex cytochrome b subunit